MSIKQAVAGYLVKKNTSLYKKKIPDRNLDKILDFNESNYSYKSIQRAN